MANFEELLTADGSVYLLEQQNRWIPRGQQGKIQLYRDTNTNSLVVQWYKPNDSNRLVWSLLPGKIKQQEPRSFVVKARNMMREDQAQEVVAIRFHYQNETQNFKKAYMDNTHPDAFNDKNFANGLNGRSNSWGHLPQQPSQPSQISQNSHGSPQMTFQQNGRNGQGQLSTWSNDTGSSGGSGGNGQNGPNANSGYASIANNDNFGSPRMKSQPHFNANNHNNPNMSNVSSNHNGHGYSQSIAHLPRQQQQQQQPQQYGMGNQSVASVNSNNPGINGMNGVGGSSYISSSSGSGGPPIGANVANGASSVNPYGANSNSNSNNNYNNNNMNSNDPNHGRTQSQQVQMNQFNRFAGNAGKVGGMGPRNQSNFNSNNNMNGYNPNNSNGFNNNYGSNVNNFGTQNSQNYSNSNANGYGNGSNMNNINNVNNKNLVWECDMCKKRNQVNSSRCETCGLKRPHNAQLIDRNAPRNLNKQQPQQQQQQQPQQPSVPKVPMWHCPICTVKNDESAPKCSVCEAPKPVNPRITYEPVENNSNISSNQKNGNDAVQISVSHNQNDTQNGMYNRSFSNPNRNANFVNINGNLPSLPSNDDAGMNGSFGNVFDSQSSQPFNHYLSNQNSQRQGSNPNSNNSNSSLPNVPSMANMPQLPSMPSMPPVPSKVNNYSQQQQQQQQQQNYNNPNIPNIPNNFQHNNNYNNPNLPNFPNNSYNGQQNYSNPSQHNQHNQQQQQQYNQFNSNSHHSLRLQPRDSHDFTYNNMNKDQHWGQKSAHMDADDVSDQYMRQKYEIEANAMLGAEAYQYQSYQNYQNYQNNPNQRQNHQNHQNNQYNPLMPAANNANMPRRSSADLDEEDRKLLQIGSHPVQPVRPVQPLNTWKCPLCTLVNQMSSSRCDACLTPRPGAASRANEENGGAAGGAASSAVQNGSYGLAQSNASGAMGAGGGMGGMGMGGMGGMGGGMDAMGNIKLTSQQVMNQINDMTHSSQVIRDRKGRLNVTKGDFDKVASDIATYSDNPVPIYMTLKSVAKKLLKDDVRYRTLDTTNPKVIERLVGFVGVIDFLQLLGFESDAMGTKLVCKDKPDERIVDMACDTLNQYKNKFGGYMDSMSNLQNSMSSSVSNSSVSLASASAASGYSGISGISSLNAGQHGKYPGPGLAYGGSGGRNSLVSGSSGSALSSDTASVTAELRNSKDTFLDDDTDFGDELESIQGDTNGGTRGTSKGGGTSRGGGSKGGGLAEQKDDAAGGGKQQDDDMTLKQLILWSTHENLRDTETMETLIMTHKQFCPSIVLLKELRNRFFVEPPRDIVKNQEKLAAWEAKDCKRIRLKVIKAIRDWMKNYWTDDFEDNFDNIRDELGRWIEEMMIRTPGQAAQQVKKEYERLQKEGQKELWVGEQQDLSGVQVSAKFKFGEVTHEQLADQITVMDFDIFRRIKARECLGQAWKKKGNKENAPNILKMIAQFNTLTVFVQIQILQEKNLKNRIKAMKKVIKMGERFRLQKNYNSLCAVFSALNSAPIHRLKTAWGKVSKDQVEAFENYKVIFSSEMNHRNLRQLFRNSTAPCIPHIGLFLQDLVFIDDGNKAKMDNAGLGRKNMINFKKSVRVADRIKSIRMYQNHGYNEIKPDLVIRKILLQQFDNLSDINEDDLWNMSTAVKDSDKKDANKRYI